MRGLVVLLGFVAALACATPAAAQELACQRATPERVAFVKRSVDDGSIRGGYLEGDKAHRFARKVGFEAIASTSGLGIVDLVFLIENPQDGFQYLGFTTSGQVACYAVASEAGKALFREFYGARI